MPAPPGSVAHGCEECAVRHIARCSWLAEGDKRGDLPGGDIRKLKARETLVLAGDECHHVFIVVTGLLKLYRSMADGRAQMVRLALPGDLIGSPVHERHLLNAEALGISQVCQIPRAAVRDLLKTQDYLNSSLVAMVYDNLATAYDHMLLLGRMTPVERLSNLLFRLVARAERTGESTTPLFLTMRRRDMAEFLGVTLETVSRSFSYLARKGIIELRHADRVFVRDRACLERLAHVE